MTPKGEPRGSAPDERRTIIEPRLLTLDDVAVYLNVSIPQVYALVRSGELEAIKIGGRGVWRVDKAKLEAYVDRLHQEAQERIRSGATETDD